GSITPSRLAVESRDGTRRPRAESAGGDEHDVGGLDHGRDLGALLQAELSHCLDGDGSDEADAAGVENDVGDGLAWRDAGDPGGDLVACAQFHVRTVVKPLHVYSDCLCLGASGELVAVGATAYARSVLCIWRISILLLTL